MNVQQSLFYSCSMMCSFVLQALSHHCNVTSLYLIYKYFHRMCSELIALVSPSMPTGSKITPLYCGPENPSTLIVSFFRLLDFKISSWFPPSLAVLTQVQYNANRHLVTQLPIIPCQTRSQIVACYVPSGKMLCFG